MKKNANSAQVASTTPPFTEVGAYKSSDYIFIFSARPPVRRQGLTD
jgi:hypothetical protein